MKSSALIGISLAIAGIALGLYFDGGRLSQLVQPTAALIVFGGTLGALLVQFPLALLTRAAAQLKPIFRGAHDESPQLIDTLSRYAALVRRNGALALDAEIDETLDPFLRHCLMLVVDGVHSQTLRSLCESAAHTEAAADASLAKVFEAAGGFAPTIGILGAVLGLITVMQDMERISEVGRGIAVAFVATIYGVGAANLFFLPCAGRVRILMAQRAVYREMILEAAVGIAEGLGPRAIEQRLNTFTQSETAVARKPAPLVMQ